MPYLFANKMDKNKKSLKSFPCNLIAFGKPWLLKSIRMLDAIAAANEDDGEDHVKVVKFFYRSTKKKK